MAYSELVKNFNKIRDYMREFYVYGFKSRDEFTKKSARSYDDERRRMESWLGDYMRFRRTPDGKNVFISIDSRVSRHNPLYKAWKAKSFTDGDITLHFIIMDILADGCGGLTVSEISDRTIEYMHGSDRLFDESTIRKKLKEYVGEGLLRTEKSGKNVLYFKNEPHDLSSCGDALDFFSEVAPCGVVGSYLLDKNELHNDHFAFKHHYITGSFDSEIVCGLFEAMGRKCSITLETINRHKDRISENHVIPLRIMISTQSGRQYLMAFVPRFRRITSFRTDNILSVHIDEECERFDELRARLDEMQKHMWGVSTQGRSGDRLEHVDFTVRYADNEQHIHRRLEREKRCGTVEKIDDNTSRFSADVYDVSEMIPWIRTFICRITEINFSDPGTEAHFTDDITAMYDLYGRTTAVIFSELYSAYYNAVAAILKEAVSRPLSSGDIREIALRNAFGESFIRIGEALNNGDWPLLKDDGSAAVCNVPDMPLTTLQKRWLKAISLDARIRLFGDCIPDFPDVEPLFTDKDISVFDKYSDGDDYSDEGYVQRFRLILKSISERQALRFVVSNRMGKTNNFVAMPEYIEYSEKDDKFRLIASGSRFGSVINLGRIVSCRASDREWEQRYPIVRHQADQTLVLEVTDDRNALERVLLHFAHFEKEAEKIGDNKYKITLKYEKDDETEMVIRILSFGPLIKVVSPGSFIELIKNRLKLQKSCGL